VILPAEQMNTLTRNLHIKIPKQSITPCDYTTVEAMREYIEVLTARGGKVQPIE
jgi:hypothetical protein